MIMTKNSYHNDCFVVSRSPWVLLATRELGRF